MRVPNSPSSYRRRMPEPSSPASSEEDIIINDDKPLYTAKKHNDGKFTVGIEAYIKDTSMNNGFHRSRERTRISAVQRLVERRLAQKEKEKERDRSRARSNSSHHESAKERNISSRSVSASNNKTYITIGPGKPTRIREHSPTKKDNGSSSGEEDEVKKRRASVPAKFADGYKKPDLFSSPPLKSSGLLRSFTTEKSFEVNKDRKLSIDFAEVIERNSRSSPESDCSLNSAESGSSAAESVSKRRISLQERCQARINNKSPELKRRSERASTPIPGESSSQCSRLLYNISSGYRYHRTAAAVSQRRMSQGNLFRRQQQQEEGDNFKENNNGNCSKLPPRAAPRKISLQAHHYISSAANVTSLAEGKKEEGNQLYKTKSYREALNRYSEAISMCPDNPAYYGNRSACHMMLGQYTQALEDARTSINLNSNFIKGYVRIIKCCITLGDVVSARQAIERVESLEPGTSTLDNEKQSLSRLEKNKSDAQQAYEAQEYRKALYHLDQALSIATADRTIKIGRAECLAFLGRYPESQECANDVLRADSRNADAIYVRGLCLYHEDNVDKAFSHFQQVLRLAPDHRKAKAIYKKAKLLKQKKEEGNLAFKNHKLAEAYKLYSEALAIDPHNRSTNAKLYFNRATVGAKLGKLKDSISDCTAALDLDEKYLKALLRRAKSYLDLEEYDEAVRDYESVCRTDRSNHEYKRLLQHAKLELKKSKRKDYYKILGVDKNANEEEIKKAYRKRALVHHPDRHSGATEEERKQHEKVFKEVGEAYGILSDAKKRGMYDSGHDIDEMENGGGGGFPQDIDPNQIFQAFFGGAGGGGGGGMGGHQRYSFNSGGGGMPGNFTFQFG